MLLIKRFCSNYRRICHITRKDKVCVRGWILAIRRLKNYLFVDINDGSSCRKMQVVLPRNDKTKSISAGCIIEAVGQVKVAPNGGDELHAEDVEMIAEGHIEEGYPFQPKQKLPPEYVREHLHLRARVDFVAAQMRLRHRALKAIHDYMDEAGLVQINTPILTTNDCEGAGEVFTVRPESEALLREMSRPDIPLEQSYFDSKVFLSVSGQLHLEAMTYGLGSTYTLSPAFRAENSKSPLHLSEFYMFEAELAHMERMEQLIQFIEQMIKGITQKVLDKSIEDLRFCQKKALGSEFELPWIHRQWTTLTYQEAVGIIEKHRGQLKTTFDPKDGFSKEQELLLVQHCDAPVFIVDWPKQQKPFYMRVTEHNPELVHALDLLMPRVGELCGGSLRETNIEHLQSTPHFPQGLQWYLDLRKYGGMSTGGFGMGFERYLQLLTGVKNIRDVIPFPRYPHSCRM